MGNHDPYSDPLRRQECGFSRDDTKKERKAKRKSRRP
jgi:hypothetical protein